MCAAVCSVCRGVYCLRRRISSALCPSGGRLPFSTASVAEAVPALVSSFVRTVKQFDNNKQIVALAELVEKRFVGCSGNAMHPHGITDSLDIYRRLSVVLYL